MEFASSFFFFQAEDGIRDADVTGVQTCALPISQNRLMPAPRGERDQGNWCSSTRRFCARPAAVVLAAIGLAAPSPFAIMRLGATPLLPRYARPASARACDSLRLVALKPVLSV